MKQLLLVSDAFIPLIILVSITLTNFSLRSIGINNTIVHLTLFFMVFHLLISTLLLMQSKTDTGQKPYSNAEVSGFGATVISITALISLVIIGMPFVRMFIPGGFWVDPMIVSIPVISLIILTRIIS